MTSKIVFHVGRYLFKNVYPEHVFTFKMCIPNEKILFKEL